MLRPQPSSGVGRATSTTLSTITRRRDWLPALAEAVGARRPLYVPIWLGKLIAGEHMAAMMTQVRAGSNAKAKRELAWQPAHPSWREGFAEVAAQSIDQRVAA